ncbi:terpene cyclase/mutase family protein [Streptomyces griseus]|uniref:Terpene cyclase/mutase family protein n=2 Tax=Streptomyces TaxID=1883 RepID=A0ABU2W7U0_9ACTN|nr:prenyltransferase/squalene oxidase repeat-containing protein [Streptomyces griseus]MDT0493953.1 terpene cyclase/mutase family protein [Streptomyces griseus]
MRMSEAGANPWPTELFPSELAGVRQRMVSALAARVGPDGAVRDPCGSRVLESALAAALLERTGLEGAGRKDAGLERVPSRGGAADAVRRFLRTRMAGGAVEATERSLAAAVLDRRAVTSPGPLVRQVTGTAPDFTAGRKQALVHAFAAAVDDRFPACWNEAAFDLSGLHSWAAVQVTASKVILARATGNTTRISDEDVRLLLDTQGRPHVWEGNVLIHLSVLHALSGLPGTGTVVREGLRRALEHQRADGGLPFVTDTDTWSSATAGVALAAAGAPRNVLERVAAHLVGRQLPGGGWSYTDLSYQTDVDDTSVAVQFLHSLDPARYREPITRGLDSMAAVASPDGGYPTYVAGAPAECCMTAAVVDALTVRPAAHAARVRAGLLHLAAHQRADGSFPPDWSSSRLHTVFRVLLAASRSPRERSAEVRRMVERSMRLVLDRQNGDGGWGQQDGEASDVISTAYGLIAVCGQDDPQPALAAVSFLVAAERDGSVRGARPDSIGPRPFVFTVPVLADVFTVLALGHLARRTAPAGDVTGTGRAEGTFGTGPAGDGAGAELAGVG